MRRLIKKSVATVIVAMMILTCFTMAYGAIPQGYWQYMDPFTKAKEAGNGDEIIRIGNEVIGVFASQPLDNDKAAIMYNTYSAMYPAYEKKGDYDSAIRCLKEVVTYAKYLGFDDAVKMATARIRQIDAMTMVYALTNNTSSVPYYGMKNEPKNGTYYGRVYAEKGTAPMSEETAISFYVECLDENIKSFDYLIKPWADGKRIIHIAFNMPHENDSLKAVVQSSADAYLKETMEYLNSLNAPVLLRIGGEMNVWENLADAALYKQAYLKIADMASQYASNVALVFSPNDISNWNVDIDDYYPGDSYVDWVGVSLYTNKYRNYLNPVAGKDDDEMYYGAGAYSNPLTKLKDIVDRYGSKKPIIMTEGGTGYKAGGLDLTEYAKSRINMLYTYANMLYPQVKGMIYFDVDLGASNKYEYSLSKNQQVMEQYKSSTAANQAFIKSMGSQPAAYVKAGSYSDSQAEIKLYTYCILPGDVAVTVNYYLDGQKINSASSMPYNCNINAAGLAAGQHELRAEVKGANGYAKTLIYALNKSQDGLCKITESAGAVSINVVKETKDEPDTWAADEVKKAVDANLVPSELQNKYKELITRKEFCDLIIKLIEAEKGQSIDAVLSAKGLSTEDNPFIDTSAKTVIAANKLGIVNGTDAVKGTFEPNGAIKRQEAAVMLTNAAKALGADVSATEASYADKSSIDSWAKDAVNYVSKAKVMNGTEQGFEPLGTYTRQQAFLTVYRLLEALK